MENLMSHWGGSYRFPRGDFSWISLPFDEGTKHLLDGWVYVCVSCWDIVSPRVFIGWVVGAGTQAFPPKGSGPEGTIGLDSLHTKSPWTGSKYRPFACSSFFDGFFPINPQVHYCQQSLEKREKLEKERKLHLERRLLCTLFTTECKKK